MFKAFYKSHTANCLKKIVQRPTASKRDLQVLRECSSWASRSSAAQMFFLTQPEHVFGCVAGVNFL